MPVERTSEADQSEQSSVEALFLRDQELRHKMRKVESGSGYHHHLEQEMRKNDEAAFHFVAGLSEHDVLTLTPADQEKIAFLIVHFISGPIDDPAASLERLAQAWTAVRCLWDLRVPFGQGHLGHNILNRLSGYARFSTQSPVFLSFEGNISADHVEYLAGEAFPVQTVPPLTPTTSAELIANIAALYESLQ